MSEGRRFQRLLTILNEVTTRPGLHPGELADELGVSERTLRRDLAELRAAGSAAGTLPVLYEQQLRLVRGLYPDAVDRIRAEVEAQAPQLLSVLFQQAIERVVEPE